jgi:hypothetical protein
MKESTSRGSMDGVESMLNAIISHVHVLNKPEIILLKNKQVLQWLFNDLSFLNPTNATQPIKNKCKDMKTLEDAWGRAVMKSLRPDLGMDKQWTNLFGEYMCKELYALQGKATSKPLNKNNFQPDVEIDDAIVEVKTQTYHTTGTAGEKIMGAAFKYAEIPELYGKPLKIMCFGGAEKICRESYGNLPGKKCSTQKQKFLDFFRQNQITYVGATDVLRSIYTDAQKTSINACTLTLDSLTL